jgi:dTDP-4-amino-4,6-dideoxygalactose transaminase/CelD/BcsL family acetyltransferase involved in cellulose biosynthesis
MTLTRLGTFPPLPLDVYLRPPVASLPFPLHEPGYRMFAKARHALWHGVQALGLREGDEILSPAYHHGSEIEALSRAGLVCRFYDVTPALEPDPAELEAMITARTRALYLIHYLGFPQDAARWLGWCRERGLLLIEDAAQAWLATVEGHPVGSFGDLAIFCLYKTVGVPDGGVLVSRQLPDQPSGSHRLGGGTLARRHGAWLILRSTRLAGFSPWFERKAGPLESEHALGRSTARPAALTKLLLSRLLESDPKAQRSFNYQLLLDELGDYVPKPFTQLPEGACPFAFPIETDDKRSMMALLERHRIIPLDLWSVPHRSLPVQSFPQAAQLRKKVVGLPVHQELGLDHIERIIKVVRGTPGPMASELELEVFSTLEPLKLEWSRLADCTRNIFATWEWASTWWQHYGCGRRLLVTTVRSRGRLIGILPLYEWRIRPFRVLRFLGHGPGDQLGPICAPADTPVVARALRHALNRMEWDIVVAELLSGQGWHTMLGGQLLSREGNPLVHLGEDGWQGLLESRTGHFRKHLRRELHTLRRDHRIRYRLVDGSRDLADELDILFRLHAARWSNDSSSFTAHEAFHRSFASVALEKGWLRLWFLEADEQPVAALSGFRFAGTESHYQGGRDPAWSSHSLGFVLLAHAIEQAANDGMQEYRLLRGGEAYKYRFATADPGLQTVGVTRGPVAALTLPLLTTMRGSDNPLGRVSRRIITRR